MHNNTNKIGKLPPFKMSTSTIKYHISKGVMVAWMNSSI